MPFNPADFVEVARRLDHQALTPTEACLRASVGRSYYGPFLVAFSRLNGLGIRYVPSAGPSKHQWLLQRLRTARDTDVRALGDRLASLLASRAKADYELDQQLLYRPSMGLEHARRAEEWIREFCALDDVRLRAAIR